MLLQAQVPEELLVPVGLQLTCLNFSKLSAGALIDVLNVLFDSSLIYIYVAIHALASMPSAPRLSDADSKTSTEVPCLYALRMPQAFCKNIAIDSSLVKAHSKHHVGF
jgi:hypothetical protein